MKTDQITEKMDKLLQIAPWLPTPENLSSLIIHNKINQIKFLNKIN